MARSLLRLAALLGGVGLVFAYPHYRRDRQAAVARLRAGSQIFQSPKGVVEYAISGAGQPILSLHGMGGGYDQGLLLTRSLDPIHYQTIAISRPGHRVTPLDTGRTPASQADAACALLDHLKIDRCVVLALSGGGMAAVEFTARYPERCAALVLVSAHTHFSRATHGPIWLVWLARVVMASDYAFWLLNQTKLIHLITEHWLIGSERMRNASNLGLIEDLLKNMFPVSEWRHGTINDIDQLFNLDVNIPAQVHIPTLILHGAHDTIVPYEVARLTASAIPGAKLVTIPGGSHFTFGSHVTEIRAAINDFLDEVL